MRICTFEDAAQSPAHRDAFIRALGIKRRIYLIAFIVLAVVLILFYGWILLDCIRYIRSISEAPPSVAGPILPSAYNQPFFLTPFLTIGGLLVILWGNVTYLSACENIMMYLRAKESGTPAELREGAQADGPSRVGLRD